MRGKKPRVVGIIQARLGSTRLPLKSLLSLRGLPVIDWVTTRLAQSRHLDQILVAIPDTGLDRILGEHLKSRQVAFVAGPEDDVLSRFVQAARFCQADLVARVCADNPLVWGRAVDLLVDFYLAGNWDYAWNHVPRNNLWPDGFGAEIASLELLEHLANLAKLPAQREHVFNYLWDNAGQFKMGTFDPGEEWLRRPDVRLDIDSVADYAHLARLPLAPQMDAREILSFFP